VNTLVNPINPETGSEATDVYHKIDNSLIQNYLEGDSYMAKVSGGGMTNARALQVSSCPSVPWGFLFFASRSRACVMRSPLSLAGSTHFGLWVIGNCHSFSRKSNQTSLSLISTKLDLFPFPGSTDQYGSLISRYSHRLKGSWLGITDLPRNLLQWRSKCRTWLGRLRILETSRRVCLSTFAALLRSLLIPDTWKSVGSKCWPIGYVLGWMPFWWSPNPSS